MNSISKNIDLIKQEIPQHVNLVAVSKFQSNDSILEAYSAGQRLFGENYVQELCDKAEKLPQDIQWHFIGHLQSNKVKYIAPFVSMIHSVDSKKLLLEIEKQAAKCNRIIDVLLQIHVAQEETKSGLSPAECISLVEEIIPLGLKHTRICGVMGMASFSDDQNLIASEFSSIKTTFEKVKDKAFSNDTNFQHISMGMSGDWPLAVTKGSTMIRVGSSIFGARQMKKEN